MSPADGACAVCGTALGESPDRVAGSAVCSAGCAAIQRELPPVDPGSSADETAPTGSTVDPDAERTYLRVEGMHSDTCEAFLERRAMSLPGVRSARASYVTGTVMVEHDADGPGVKRLSDHLTTLGYEAQPRTVDVDAGEDRPAGPGEGVEELLGFRYVAGVVFGSFLLLPYVVVFYPANAAALLGINLGGVLPGPTGLGGATLTVLPLFATVTGVVVFFTGAPLLREASVALRLRRPTAALVVMLTAGAAYGYSIVALAMGRIDAFFDLTVVVAASVVAATLFETKAKRRAAAKLTDLTAAGVGTATRIGDDGESDTIETEQLQTGDRVLVRRGERVPVDGTLAEGTCTVDEAVVTGESLPVEKTAGDPLVGGSVVTDGSAVVTVDETAGGLDRLTQAVWSLQSDSPGAARRVDRIARIAVPGVAALTVLVGIGSIALGWGAGGALLASLSVPIAASPWALGLAAPLAVGTSVDQAADRGVIILEEGVLERLGEVDCVVFDKTGTLTTGEMTVETGDAPDWTLRAVGALEEQVSHPIGTAIADAFAEPGDGTPDVEDVETYTTGVGGTVDDTPVLAGRRDLFEEAGWTVPASVASEVEAITANGGLPVVVGRDGTAEGVIAVSDEPRPGWEAAVDALADRDIEVYVLTGDDPAAASVFADYPGVTNVFAEVSPRAKTAAIRRLAATRTVAMVGDGTNDAPALAAAELGIAVGTGTALAAEAAEVALEDADPRTLVTALDSARAARERLRRTGTVAIAYNAIAVPAAVIGVLNPLIAIGAAGLVGGVLYALVRRPLTAPETTRF